MRPNDPQPTPIAETLFPIESEARDWTETACCILAAGGTGYFTIHLIVAAVRASLS